MPVLIHATQITLGLSLRGAAATPADVSVRKLKKLPAEGCDEQVAIGALGERARVIARLYSSIRVNCPATSPSAWTTSPAIRADPEPAAFVQVQIHNAQRPGAVVYCPG